MFGQVSVSIKNDVRYDRHYSACYRFRRCIMFRSYSFPSNSLPPLLILALTFVTMRSIAQPAGPVMPRSQESASVRFTENRGQVIDTRGEPRTDILYTSNSAGVQVYLRTSGISYVF